jgi:hypothetical protein
MDWTTGRSGFDPRQRQVFFPVACVQTVSYQIGTGGSFPGGKARSGRDTNHSRPSSARVKNE